MNLKNNIIKCLSFFVIIINYYAKLKNKNRIIKIYFLFFIFSTHIIIIFKLKNNIKICICTVGKNENRYIKEYIEYYKNYGVDKIFLYDNNDFDGENFNKIINEFINQNFVEIKNWRGIQSPQMMIYNDCYSKNYDKYEWLMILMNL